MLSKINLIDICPQDFALCIVPFQQHCHDYFIAFPPECAFACKKEILYQLLCECAAALLNFAAEKVR